MLLDFHHRSALFLKNRDNLEHKFLQHSGRVTAQDKKSEYSKKCFQEASEHLETWIKQVKAEPCKHQLPFVYAMLLKFHLYKAKMNMVRVSNYSILPLMILFILVIAILIKLVLNYALFD